MKTYMSFCLSLILVSSLHAQPHYTKLRAGFSLEALSIAPVTMFSAEVPIAYKSRGFWNLQTGIGITGKVRSAYAPSFSSAVTYNFLLNPYRRNVCNPAPEFNRFESYLETGVAASIFESGYTFLPQKLYSNAHFRTAGVLGIRLHFLNKRWVYILKIRLTPFLDKKFSVWGGAGIGLGWK